MKIMVSACLLGRNCKYSGGNNLDEKVVAYLQGHEVIPVCASKCIACGICVKVCPMDVLEIVEK